MKLELKPSLIKFKDKVKPLLRHFPIIIFVLIAAFLVFGVLSVMQILNQPTDQAYLDEQEKNNVLSRFDDQTIQKVNNLKSRQENTNLNLPGDQRVNPFTE